MLNYCFLFFFIDERRWQGRHPRGHGAADHFYCKGTKHFHFIALTNRSPLFLQLMFSSDWSISLINACVFTSRLASPPLWTPAALYWPLPTPCSAAGMIQKERTTLTSCPPFCLDLTWSSSSKTIMTKSETWWVNKTTAYEFDFIWTNTQACVFFFFRLWPGTWWTFTWALGRRRRVSRERLLWPRWRNTSPTAERKSGS